MAIVSQMVTFSPFSRSTIATGVSPSGKRAVAVQAAHPLLAGVVQVDVALDGHAVHGGGGLDGRAAATGALPVDKRDALDARHVSGCVFSLSVLGVGALNSESAVTACMTKL
jgi:hypothetical protein